MKKNRPFLMTCLSTLILFFPGILFANKTLYDDFSTGHLDGKKWWPREYAREIVDGKLITILGNSNEMGAEISPGLFNNPLNFKEPNSIDTIEVEVTIVETQLDSPGSYSAERVGGYFYNINDTGGSTGDIFAHIKIGDMGNGGLEAAWTAYKVIDDDGTLELIEDDTLVSPGVIKYNNPINVKISYDGDRTISFSANGQTDSFEGPVRKRTAVTKNKGFATTILTQSSLEKGYIYAKLDNVRINNQTLAYDDFSSALIDLTKWKSSEWVREASNGYLRANIIGSDTTDNVNTRLTEHDVPYLEAKVRIDSSSAFSVGGYGVGRIQGYYYNDSRGPGSGQDYNQYEGDVFVRVRLKYNSDGTMTANAYIDRCNEGDESDYTNLFSHEFSVPISPDNYYALSIRFEGKKLILGCSGETAEYNISTPIYPAYGEHRLLRSRIYLDSGETGYLKVNFDDVYIEKKVNFIPSVPLLLLEE